MTGPYRGRNRAAEVACLADRENGLRATGRWGGGSSRRRCGSPHPTTRAEARRRGRRCHSPWRPRRRAALWPFAHARLAPTSRPGPMSWASPRRSWLSSARFLTGFVSARCFRRARDAACRNRMRGAPNSLLAPTNLPGCTRFLGLPPRRRSQIAAPRTRATRSPLPDRGYQVAAIRSRLSDRGYPAPMRREASVAGRACATAATSTRKAYTSFRSAMSCADAEDSRVSGLAFRCTHSAMAPRVDGNINAAMNAVSPHPQGTAINGTRISTPTSLVASSDYRLRVGTRARGRRGPGSAS
jgi:hypothetical protein